MGLGFFSLDTCITTTRTPWSCANTRMWSQIYQDCLILFGPPSHGGTVGVVLSTGDQIFQDSRGRTTEACATLRTWVIFAMICHDYMNLKKQGVSAIPGVAVWCGAAQRPSSFMCFPCLLRYCRVLSICSYFFYSACTHKIESSKGAEDKNGTWVHAFTCHIALRISMIFVPWLNTGTLPVVIWFHIFI